MRPTPDELADVLSGTKTDADLDFVLGQRPEHAVERPGPVELIEDQTYDGTHLLVWIEDDLAGRPAQVTRRHGFPELSSPRLLQLALQEALPQDV